MPIKIFFEVLKDLGLLAGIWQTISSSPSTLSILSLSHYLPSDPNVLNYHLSKVNLFVFHENVKHDLDLLAGEHGLRAQLRLDDFN